ncbi:MAG: ankyrin repeat domain-containing protein [Acidimicrobiales bacterium]
MEISNTNSIARVPTVYVANDITTDIIEEEISYDIAHNRYNALPQLLARHPSYYNVILLDIIKKSNIDALKNLLQIKHDPLPHSIVIASLASSWVVVEYIIRQPIAENLQQNPQYYIALACSDPDIIYHIVQQDKCDIFELFYNCILFQNASYVNHLLTMCRNELAKTNPLYCSTGGPLNLLLIAHIYNKPNTENSIITLACAVNNIFIVEDLIEAGITITNLDPVIYAVKNCNIKMLKCLIDNGAPYCDEDILHIAIRNNNYNITSYLIKKYSKNGIAVQRNHLLEAAIQRNFPTMHKLIAHRMFNKNDANDTFYTHILRYSTEEAYSFLSYALQHHLPFPSPALYNNKPDFKNIIETHKLLLTTN